MFKMLATILIILLCAGCDTSQDKLEVGPVISETIRHITIDGWAVSSRDVPPGATDIVYLGKGWLSFKIKDECFLLKSSGRASVFSSADVCK